MTEIELKFQIPPPRRDDLRRAVATRGATTTELRAVYFDTADGVLARERMALRLRREGDVWVQTLKALSDRSMERLEDNRVLSPEDLVPGTGQPRPDAARHAGTAAGERLLALLAGSELVETYRTEISRTHRVVQREQASIEVALDEGVVRSGERAWPVFELELELLSGPVADLVTVARTWVDWFGLWLDPRSKAEYGARLMAGVRLGPVVRAQAVRLPKQASVHSAWQSTLSQILAHALGNACELCDTADGDPGSQSLGEHLHQCRVALRRLRSAHRLFAALGSGLPQATIDSAADLFRRLGSARDRDVLISTLDPLWMEAHCEPLPWPGSITAVRPAEVLREAATTHVWLSLIAALHDAPPASDPRLEPLATTELKRQHKRLARNLKDLDALDAEARHDLRKRLKRQRYAVDACNALYGRKPVRPYLQALAEAQDALGQSLDLRAALEQVRTRSDAEDRRVALATGWLMAQIQRADDWAARAAQAVLGCREPWR